MSFITINTKNISDELKKIVAEQQNANALNARLVVATESIAISLETIVVVLKTPPQDEGDLQEQIDELVERQRLANDKLASDVDANTRKL